MGGKRWTPEQARQLIRIHPFDRKGPTILKLDRMPHIADFAKTTDRTPKAVIEFWRRLHTAHDAEVYEGPEGTHSLTPEAAEAVQPVIDPADVAAVLGDTAPPERTPCECMGKIPDDCLGFVAELEGRLETAEARLDEAFGLFHLYVQEANAVDARLVELEAFRKRITGA